MTNILLIVMSVIAISLAMLTTIQRSYLNKISITAKSWEENFFQCRENFKESNKLNLHLAKLLDDLLLVTSVECELWYNVYGKPLHGNIKTLLDSCEAIEDEAEFEVNHETKPN
jgi:hypothetical protein